MMTGDRARQYQAEQISFFSGEVFAVPRRGRVSSAVLRKLRSAYAPPDCEEEMLKALSESPVQCLIGQPRTGRTTAALVLAAKHLERTDRPAEGNVNIVASERGLAAIDPSALPKHKALILVLQNEASAPDASWFSPIDDGLRKRSSVLIVVTSTEPDGPAALRENWTIRYVPPPPVDVFRQHLGRRFSEAEIDEVLAVHDVQDDVQRCKSPREAAGLAADVIAALDSGVSTDDLLSGREPSSLEAARKELRGNDFWQRIFLMTATVLPDETAGTVTREATRLAELHETNLSHTGARSAEWFTRPINEWSDCVDLAGHTSSDGSGRVVKLSHPRLATYLLEDIWQDHLAERDILIAWLQGLGAHPHSRVRVKVAQAAAQLACYDCDVIIREVIQPWALDGGFRTRQTCSWALEALAVAADGRFAKKVRGIVRSWVRSNNVQLLAAAVTAYGTFLGATDPDEALERMREVIGGRVQRWDGQRDSSADRVERELANIVQHAVLAVFAAGAEERVIYELADWTRLPHWRWRRAATRCLLSLARQHGQADGWPLLAELAIAQPIIYTDTLRLWCNALDPVHRDESGWTALRQWCDLAEDSPAAIGSFALADLTKRLLTDLKTSSPGLAANLEFHEKIWAFRRRERQTSRL